MNLSFIRCDFLIQTLTLQRDFNITEMLRMTYFSGFMIALLLLVISYGCSKKPDDIQHIPDEPISYQYDMENLIYYDGFNQAEIRGVLENQYIVEASGLAVSRSNPSLLWVHNDSGDYNRLFVVGEDAKDYGEFILRGALNRDWEDIAAGPGPIKDITYLYVGEIGDNHAQYDIMSVYRVPEPDISGLDSVTYTPVEDVERIDYIYPDGPRDAETLMVDPFTRDLYVITKRDERSGVYLASYPQSTGEIITLRKVGLFPFNRALAGDISADGREILVKTDDRIYYWSREPGEAVFEAFRRQPLLLPYTIEPQGEAIGWMPDGSGYYTLSEKTDGIEPVLYFYGRK